LKLGSLENANYYGDFEKWNNDFLEGDTALVFFAYDRLSADFKDRCEIFLEILRVLNTGKVLHIIALNLDSNTSLEEFLVIILNEKWIH
jgi:hypothetical protein